ncbi:4'-phosphopantetheinyl transferase family protein [Streptomyces sp. NPDC003758]|uniref:4'-phosphopantetheinyl transferase superfamily protein n=1 Tax=Streptomyces cynarae TaxID=2981134 RepID=A0ABY6DYL2_9ACTN|nr:4'-phosphopantetheinyl transferase superfamily protein [Streptomyces cynarae]UXY19495.1 4'-phosphopantetheinyl transferase superfamily protein [Streptomyces cynarae]
MTIASLPETYRPGPDPTFAPGPRTPLPGLDQALAATGYALVWGRPADWAPEPAAIRRLLGREFGRYERIGSPEHRHRFAASRMLLKHAAAAALGAEPEQLELARRPGGRPYVRGCDQLEVSLSHTGRMLVVAVSQLGLVGVDVEAADRPVLGSPVERDICIAREAEDIGRLPAERRNAALVRLWTLKEAYSKALGFGMRLPFTSFGFEPVGGEGPGRLLRADGVPVEQGGWSFQSHVLDGAYTASAAISRRALGPTRDTQARTMLDGDLAATVLAAAAHRAGPEPARDGAESGPGR